MLTLRAATLSLALTLSLLWVRTSFAQPLADQVPADAILYVGWAGADHLGASYEQSHLKAVRDLSEFDKLIDQTLPQLAAKFGQQQKEAQEAAAMFSGLAKPLWKHPTAFFFAGLAADGGGQPMPKIGLLCRAGASAGDLKKQLDTLLAQAPPEARQMIQTRVAGDLLTVTVGYGPAGLAVGGVGKGLAADPQFTSTLTRVGKSPVVVAYANVQRAWMLADKLVKEQGPPEQQAQYEKLRDASGLKGIEQVIWTSGFEGKEWADHIFVHAPAPRAGLLALADAGPLTDASLQVIPKGATMAGAVTFDAGKLIETIRGVALGVEPGAAGPLDDALQQINGTLGFDIQKDLLQAMGTEWAYYTDPTIGGRSVAGAVFINHLRDAAKAEESLGKLEKLANDLLAQQMKNEQAKPQIFTTVRNGLTIHYFGTPLITPSWAIADGNLYVGLVPQTVAGAAAHVAAKGPSILENPDFVALRKRLGGEHAGGISFLNLPQTAPDGYAEWSMISRLSGAADLFGVQSPAMLMPPLGELMPHLTPAGSVSWMDKEGWHLRAITPFPGSTMLAVNPLGGGMAAQAGLATSILLPSLNRAREQANRVKSASNLRQIGLGAMMYANEKKGRFPATLAEIVRTQDLTWNVFVNPRSTGAATPPAGTDPEQLAKWVEQNSDYVWTGAGLKTSANADTVLAYEKPQGLTDGINFLFADSHVEFLSMAVAMEKIKAAEKPVPAPRQ